MAGAVILAVAGVHGQPTTLQPGQKIWEFQTGGPVTAPAIGTDGTVYFGSADKKAYALDGQTGSKKWELQASDVVSTFPVVAPDGTVYVVSGATTEVEYRGSGATILALDGATGTTKLQLSPGRLASPPAVGADGTLFLAGLKTTGGNLSAVDPDGTIYFGCQDGKAYALKGTAGLASGPWPKFQQNAQNTGLLQVPTPPTLLAQPTNQFVLVGSGAKFAVFAAGALPLQYQWQKDEQPIPGATNHLLLLSST